MKATKIYLCCSLLLAGFVGSTQVRMEKDFNESFNLSAGNKVEIANKYGEVIIRTWQEDRVRIQAKVTANGRNQETVNKTMNRVDIQMRKIGQVVTVSTEIARGGGTFNELLGDVEDYSKAFFGNQKLTVDMEVWLPENIDLTIDNKYGDIYLGSLLGEVDITLAHGDLTGNRVEGRLEMEHSFGKSNFDFVNRGRFTLRGAEITIDEGTSFSFQSSSSEINLYNIHYVKIDSRNDKIKAGNVNEIVGMGRFTDLEAERITRNVDLKFEFGEIWLSQIEQKFQSINLIGKSTDFNLVLNQASYIQSSIRGDEDKMIVPNSMLSLTRDFNEEDETVRLTGMVGPTQDFISKLTLDADGGDVIISIKETPIFTDRR